MQWKDTSDCNVYRIGRKYETTTNRDTEMKNCKLPMALVSNKGKEE
jgi:hypothetical protein